MDFEQEVTEVTEVALKKNSVFSVSSCEKGTSDFPSTLLRHPRNFPYCTKVQ